MKRPGSRASAAVALAAALTGCAAMQSVAPNGPADTGAGLVYRLPLAHVPFRVLVSASGDRVSVMAEQPEFTGDPRATYALNAIWGPFNSDSAKIDIDKDTLLLRSVSLDSKGELDETLVAVAKSAAAVRLEASVAPDRSGVTGDDVVAELSLDLAALADDPAALAAVNERIARGLAGRAARGEADAVVKAAAAPGALTLRVERISGPAPAETPAPDCSVGLCYRLPTPYLVEATFPDGSTRASVVSVPNGSPTYATAIRRGVFADWKTAVTLENGMPVGFSSESGSEGVELAALPFELVGGAIAGLGERARLAGARADVISKELELIEALNRSRANLENAAKAGPASPIFLHSYGAPPERLPQIPQSGSAALDPG